MNDESSGNFTADTLVSRSADQVSCEIDGEIVALSVGKGRYYQMDKVGRLIWEEIKEPVSVLSLRDEMVARFEVDEERCLSDIRRFLEDMLEAGLVVRHGVAVG